MEYYSNKLTKWCVILIITVFTLPSIASPPKSVAIENNVGYRAFDPYRWMENGDEYKLNQWINEQRNIVEEYLSNSLKKEIFAELQANKIGSKKRLMQKLENQFEQQINQKIPLIGTTETLLNGAKSFSGRYQVFFTANNGGDLKTLQIFDNDQNQYLRDTLQVKFASVAWSSNDEYLIYSTDRDHRNGGTHYVVAAHKIGEATNLYDKVIWESGNAVGSADIVSINGNDYLITANDANQEMIIYEINTDTQLLGEELWRYKGNVLITRIDESSIYFISYDNYSNGEVFRLDLSTLKEELFLPTYDLPIHSISFMNGNVFVNYFENDVTHRVMKFIPKSKELKPVSLPFPGIYSIYSSSVYAQSYSVPFVELIYNDEKLAIELTKEAEIVLQNVSIDAKPIQYTLPTGDTTVVWVMSKKGTKLNQNTPLYLYGYGGFKVNVLPRNSFLNQYMPLLNRGGAVAVVTLPGGLEKGEDWHKLGNLLNKKNVFDAMAAAARELQKQKISSREHMAIGGGSNGGLLVAATVNKYPYLFKAAVPEVGVLDSLRYHKYTAGKWWVSEYGDPDNKEHYYYLKSYSPYHNIKHRDYPSILVMTSDGDDRVVPAHSYKYTARLQDKLKSSYINDSVVLLYTQKFGSHGGSADPEEKLNARAAKLAFLIKELE